MDNSSMMGHVSSQVKRERMDNEMRVHAYTHIHTKKRKRESVLDPKKGKKKDRIKIL